MSNYNDLVLSETDKMVSCPYNKAHMILFTKFTKHLNKCRTSHPNSNIKLCRFNPTAHHIPATEIANHESKCPDRVFIENLIEAKSVKRKSDVPEPISESVKRVKGTDTDDEWDAPNQRSRSKHADDENRHENSKIDRRSTRDGS